MYQQMDKTKNGGMSIHTSKIAIAGSITRDVKGK